MIFKFNQRLFGVDSVRISGYTEDGQHIVMPMELIDDEWVCDIEVTDNAFRYRFLVNGNNIKFNDPNASYYMIDCFGDVWSIYNKLTKSYDKPIKIDKIVISDRVMNDINKIRTKKTLGELR